MAPVMREFHERKLQYYYAHSGQHDVRDLCQSLGVRPPDLSLEIPQILRGRFGGSIQALYWSIRTMWRLRRVFLDKKRVGDVKLVLVHGDTMTTATAALAARLILFHRPLVGHVEAGLRSGNLMEPYPEEASRRIADFCSDLFFAPTNKAAGNLIAEGVPKEKIFATGNTNVDVLMQNLPLAKKSGFKLPKTPYVFAQLHRQENIKSRQRFEAFVELLEKIPCKVMFVFLENARAQAKKFGFEQRILSAPNVVSTDNLPYHDFLRAFSNASCIVTDGGGEIEEACALKIPCIVFRHASERQEAEEAGCAVRIGHDAQKALSLVNEVLAKGDFYKRAAHSQNPFGDGRAAKKIADAVAKALQK